MKRNYDRIIDVLLGVLFVILILNFAQSITFLDNYRLYFGEYQNFANTILNNDCFLIGFTTASIFICILYAICDYKQFTHRKFYQAVLGIVLLGISIYIFIILTSLRNKAYSIENFSTQVEFSLFTTYRDFSLSICVSQFIIAVHALVRSGMEYYREYKEKLVEDDIEEKEN